MKTRVLLFAAVAVLPCSGWAKPPRPQGTPAPVVTLSEQEVRETIEHMQRLDRDQKQRLASEDALNSDLAQTVTKQAAELTAARTANVHARLTTKDLATQIRGEENDLEEEKWGRFKDRIFGWPVAVFIGVVLGVLGSVFSRLGVKVAALGARAGLKATTGV